MATLAQLNQFIQYLNDQTNICQVNGHWYGQPYVWGGQHYELTPSNYQARIHAREADTGGYPGGPTYEEAAKAYCKRLFDAGMSVLYAYDCSGLGCYWLYNVAGIFPDTNADGMLRRCTLYQNDPKRGWWCFKVNANGRGTHVGFMVDNTHVVEAEGRKTGVIIREWDKSQGWKKWGIPKIWEGVIPAPGQPRPGHTDTTSDTPTTTSGIPAEGTFFLRIKVRGNKRRSVNVRRGPSTDFPVLFVAHGGDSFPLLAVSPSTGWYKIETPRGDGYITNRTKYTDMEESTV